MENVNDQMIIWLVMASGFGTAVIYSLFKAAYDKGFENGYWRGRADGWKVSIRKQDHAIDN
jgi:hypothetical protein